ncbi:MAG TPA: hypothetical protein VFE63_16080 [Roseiarcus sp.]|nr:hypothetical protein [Roseiarcus sp.]
MPGRHLDRARDHALVFVEGQGEEFARAPGGEQCGGAIVEEMRDMQAKIVSIEATIPSEVGDRKRQNPAAEARFQVLRYCRHERVSKDLTDISSERLKGVSSLARACL